MAAALPNYDNVSRLSQLVHNPAGTSYDLTIDLSYNPASQIASTTRSNDAYAWGGHYAIDRNYAANGLNQYTAAGGASFSYDSRGNLTSDGTNTYSYDSENRLVSASGSHSATLAYDPLGRLSQITTGSATTRFLYDGSQLVAEYDGTGAMTHRYVHGDALDTPEVSYDTSSLSSPHFLIADERGSVTAVTDASGNASAINTYDEYGIPGSGNAGRFQYTGQMWLPELGLYYYRARIYSPTLGRFLQTDPIRFRGGMNLYGYVLDDPINLTDPFGTHWKRHCVGAADGQLKCGWHWEEDPHDGDVTAGDPWMGSNACGFSFCVRIPLTPHQECHAAVERIKAATAARLLQGWTEETGRVLDSLAFGGPNRFDITPAGMAQLQSLIDNRTTPLTNGHDIGGGITRYTFNFASSYERGYYGGSTNAIGALIGRSDHVDMRGDRLVHVEDTFDYEGSYSEADISAGVAWANSELNANCPDRQGGVTISGTIP